MTNADAGASGGPRIPRVFHRIWLDDPIPDQFEIWWKCWQELHPGWEFMSWDDSSLLPELRQQQIFERARRIIPRDWKRFQSDLLRLELLWRYGGVYVDCDIEPLKPLDPLLDGVEAFAGWSPNRGRRGERIITQALLGARPEHPWIGACLDAIPDAVERYRGRPLAQMIGPWHVTRAWEQHPEAVTIFDEGVFYPQSIRSRDAGEQANLSDAYTHHRWNTTARKRGIGIG